jgi:hypothetical protein
LVKNAESVRNLELELLRKSRADYSSNIRLVEALYNEAVLMGAFPPRDKLSGLEVDLEIARVINSVSKTP